ncbi:hypothetical protein BpHYR1_004862 [Brachionus plicatilis]|uniref:Uncharacterized protein n=1 Tax=Brachionus plicatilis TaxID=10195 RepID=A0A3M7SY75_BRAPC|nr:hypothetical protein BpHYR1_004862 [Brachionus plicatilis]
MHNLLKQALAESMPSMNSFLALNDFVLLSVLAFYKHTPDVIHMLPAYFAGHLVILGVLFDDVQHRFPQLKRGMQVPCFTSRIKQ